MKTSTALAARILLGTVAVSRASNATADPETTVPSDPIVSLQAADHVPDNPAIDLLGAEDLKITKPGSVKDLDIELRSLYKDGKVVPEIAIELSPWALTAGRSSSYGDYVSSVRTRLLRRFTVSLATTSQGEGDAQVTLGALGLRLRVIDDTDWRLNRALIDCALVAIPLPPPPPSPPTGNEVSPTPPPADPALAAAVERCIASNSAPWNATQLAVGAALSSAFPQGKLRWDVHDLSAWAAFARPAGRSAAFTLGVKYLYNDARTIDAMAQARRQTFAGTATFETRHDRFGLLATFGVGGRWTHAEMTTSTQQVVGLAGGEVQFQVASDTWLALRFSAELASGGSDLISLANLKWSYDVTPTRSR